MQSFYETRIRTERLVLRAITEGDAAAVFAMYANAEVARYGSRPPMTSQSEAEEWIAKTRENYRTREGLQLGIELASDGTFLGGCTLWGIHADSRRAEVGYGLAREHWGNGYMREALDALIRYGFEVLELNRLEADIDPRNEASLRVVEKLGFTREGYMRERWIVNGEICDTVFYGLLRRDRVGPP